MTLVLLYYLGWSYLRQIEFETFLVFLLFVYSHASPLVIPESWADLTAYWFQSVQMTQSNTDFQRAFPTLFAGFWMRSPWDKHEVQSQVKSLFSLATYRLISPCLKWQQPKRWRFCEGSLRGCGGDGGHKNSKKWHFWEIQLYPENHYFTAVLQHVETCQMCGKPNSLRSLSWKRKRHNDLEPTSAALAAAQSLLLKENSLHQQPLDTGA